MQDRTFASVHLYIECLAICGLKGEMAKQVDIVWLQAIYIYIHMCLCLRVCECVCVCMLCTVCLCLMSRNR